MKKNYVKVIAGPGLALLLLPALAAHAQDTTRVLKDVVVTATKANQKQSQTGKVVTIISREQLERSAGKNVAELLNEQAGIMVNGANGNFGLNKSVYTRGLDNKYTLILLDGVLASDPSLGGGAFDLRLLAIDQIDHIEILKGGQSTLYGSDAVAGVINIVTKKGGATTPTANLIATAGSYGTVKGSLGLSAQIKNFGYNINYTHERSDGVSEAAQPDNAKVPFDHDGFHDDAFNAQFSIKATDRLKINPFLRYLYGNYKYDDGGFADANNTYTSRHINTGSNATYVLDKGLINLNYSYEDTHRTYNSAFGSSPYYGRLNFVDLYVNHEIVDHVKILVGLDDRYSQFNATGKEKLDAAAKLFGAYTSVFLNDIGSVFNLEAGGRYNHHNKYGDNWTYSVTPSFNLVNDIQLKVFGTVGTSFKAPDLTALFGQYGANINLKPEKADNYEAGVSASLFDNVLSARVVAYQNKIKDAIVYLYPQGYINQDRQQTKGIEFEPALNLKKLTIKCFYTYLKAHTESKNASGQVLELDYLYRRPKNTFGLFAGYKATKDFYFSLNWRNLGKRTDAFYNSATFATELQPLKAYNVFDGYAEYALLNHQLRLFVDVKNIFNEKYADLYGYTTLGTNFNAGLSFTIK